MHLLYSAALAALLLLSLPYWLVQAVRKHKYRAGLGERLGRVPARMRPPAAGEPGSVWVHAVSVGEVLAVSGLVAEMRRRWPGRRVFVSTTTAAGQKLARERLGEESVFYLPLDFAFAIRPWLRALRPELLVLAETEFWPNLLRLARKSGARVAVVNARISDRSFPRYRRWRGLLRGVLANVDLFLAQSEEDRRRLLEIGAPAERVQVTGNLKFDAKAAPDLVIVGTVRELMRKAGATLVIVCGSMVGKEVEHCLNTFRAVLAWNPRSLLILAPRKPEDFDYAAEAAHRWGVTCWRRSQLRDDSPLAGGVFLLDTIGELAAMYELADLAFVGGSLGPFGGHNILEPAQHGVPIMVGPHTENFREIVEIFLRADALKAVDDESFAREMLALLRDYPKREALGRRAAEVFRAQAGATARTLAALEELLGVAPVVEAVSAQPADLSRERG
jgi:3-deoxy-D-manno-octulosonic-acid transferase